MKRAKNPRRSGPPLSEDLLYRHPMSVVEIHSFPRCHGAPAYPVCPRCEKTMEREYTDFCSRCGQMLDWRYYQHAKIVCVEPDPAGEPISPVQKKIRQYSQRN